MRKGVVAGTSQERRRRGQARRGRAGARTWCGWYWRGRVQRRARRGAGNERGGRRAAAARPPEGGGGGRVGGESARGVNVGPCCAGCERALWPPPRLVARHDALFGVDHDDAVSDISARGELGLVLAQQELCDLGRHPPQPQPLRVHHVPLFRRHRPILRLRHPRLLPWHHRRRDRHARLHADGGGAARRRRGQRRGQHVRAAERKGGGEHGRQLQAARQSSRKKKSSGKFFLSFLDRVGEPLRVAMRSPLPFPHVPDRPCSNNKQSQAFVHTAVSPYFTTGCASELPGPGCEANDCTPSAPSAPSGGEGRAEDDREAASAGATRRSTREARARPPGDGTGRDPMPPSSPGVTPAGPSTLSEPVELGEAGEDERRQRRKRHQQRGKRPHRPSYDARQASKRANRGEPGPREVGRWSSGTGD